MGRPDKIVGSQQQLYAALSRADVDALLKNGAFIQKDGIGLFGGQRGAAAAHVACQRLYLPERRHFHMLVA